MLFETVLCGLLVIMRFCCTGSHIWVDFCCIIIRIDTKYVCFVRAPVYYLSYLGGDLLHIIIRIDTTYVCFVLALMLGWTFVVRRMDVFFVWTLSCVFYVRFVRALIFGWTFVVQHMDACSTGRSESPQLMDGLRVVRFVQRNSTHSYTLYVPKVDQ